MTPEVRQPLVAASRYEGVYSCGLLAAAAAGACVITIHTARAGEILNRLLSRFSLTSRSPEWQRKRTTPRPRPNAASAHLAPS